MTNRARVMTLIGAGGKTTCLRALTQEIETSGYPVTATTTTKVYPETHIEAWHRLQPPSAGQTGAYFWYSEAEEKSGKWLGFSPAVVDKAIQGESQRYWVIEGDGARERRLKCWAGHEPQIPGQSDCGVLVIDGSLWGQVLKAEDVHRAEHCPDLLNLPWTAENAWRYFLRSPVFWPQYRQLSWVILMNLHGTMREPGLPDLADQVLEALDAGWLKLREQRPELEQSLEPAKRPKGLRLAAGDAKEGRLAWFDLW